jgi:undecaprenyl-diphosphatase
LAAAEGGSARLGRALALGLMHGPAELLPISSSGHVELVPWLLGSDGVSSDPELRKAFEVALHAGTAAALLVVLRGEVRQTLAELDLRSAAVVALSLLPPVVAGFALERPIERHLGRPPTIAAGLIAGGLALAWADGRSPRQRGFTDAAPADGWWLGVAQACALFPGVSRNGATLTAARLRRFARPDAERLSRHVALPVICGATALKLLRLGQRGAPAGSAPVLALGAAAAFGSTLASTPLIGLVEQDRSLAPFAVYRVALGSVALRRLRRAHRRGRSVQR